MRVISFLLSCVFIVVPLVDAFETILQPRRVTHRFRFARLFYRANWSLWRAVALRLPVGRRREAFLGVFGPLSLLMLFAMWVMGLVLGFGFLHYAVSSPVHGPGDGLLGYFYLSGVAFFTLGFAELVPAGHLARALGVIEAGLGFGFLAVIVSYLPVLYGAFSKRETAISLLDARAGSPPSAMEFLMRLARFGKMELADEFLLEWEVWSAELLESHLSFPVLTFYRSQHDNQSWLATLTMILDTCAVLMTVARHNTLRAQLTYAMARHAAVDMALVLGARPTARVERKDRLPSEDRKRLASALKQAGVDLSDAPDVDARLTGLRDAYEPFVIILGERLLFRIPEIAPKDPSADNWQRSSWMRKTAGIGQLSSPGTSNDHF
ncbi:MAG TPA: hypothetical protein VIM11_28770 [Tepidisphaeraceae bacterium]